MEDDFYATIKLKTGEEIFAIASSVQENGKDLLMISTPITLSEIKSRTGMTGYKVEPWLKTTSEDMFILNMNDIITISSDTNIIMPPWIAFPQISQYDMFWQMGLGADYIEEWSIFYLKLNDKLDYQAKFLPVSDWIDIYD